MCDLESDLKVSTFAGVHVRNASVTPRCNTKWRTHVGKRLALQMWRRRCCCRHWRATTKV